MHSLVNFRDIGNVETMAGTKVKPGFFLRSGEVVGVEESTVSRLLNDYKLRTIVDLRGQKETSERPDDNIQGVDYVNIDILKDVKGQGASFEELLAGSASAHQGMLDLYGQMILTDGAQKGYQQFLEMIIEKPDKSVLFHCFAGKDRTGLAAALILGSLGVSTDLIYKDYLLTNDLRKDANQKIVDQLKKQGLTDQQLQEVLVMMNVDSRYLEHSFDIMEKEFGGFEGYITNGLHMPKSFFKDMKSAYTA
ncbi:tyrosine-protein phosphatase [Vagococcus hydrophili]|uniref:Tyrosine-protein phosphatase n=1 Tax=Vagococcus hydrophili TaxID=2714947 RepID=A0A6G8AVA7_9ENTE|nr:tyrosine-protein phosphatase [Vagococcus hydrophili]QIL48994.1 tyrosine-protein phosphatase [Vagococcus hydrophili]